jgi:hypothetical protein
MRSACLIALFASFNPSRLLLRIGFSESRSVQLDPIEVFRHSGRILTPEMQIGWLPRNGSNLFANDTFVAYSVSCIYASCSLRQTESFQYGFAGNLLGTQTRKQARDPLRGG